MGHPVVHSNSASSAGALPEEVEALSGLKLCTVVVSVDASCAATTTGELFTQGNGEFGRTGHGDVHLAPKRTEALGNECVVVVTRGRYNDIAVVRDGGVFGWGYGDGRTRPPEAAAAMQVHLVYSPCRYQTAVVHAVNRPSGGAFDPGQV